MSAQHTPVVRYEVVDTCGGHCFDVQPAPKGDWVSFDDYEAMRATLVEAIQRLLNCESDELLTRQGVRNFARATIAKTAGSAA